LKFVSYRRGILKLLRHFNEKLIVSSTVYCQMTWRFYVTTWKLDTIQRPSGLGLTGSSAHSLIEPNIHPALKYALINRPNPSTPPVRLL
jgi:hypothetical protein